MKTWTKIARWVTGTALAMTLAYPVLADDIPTLASKDPQFSTFVKLLRAADLTDTLKQKGPFTVLAPNDAAFAKLPASKIDDLLKPENKAMLRNILLYHVVAGKMTTAELSGASVGLKGPSLEGENLTLTSLEPLKVNDACIIKSDVSADNGVIQVIDTVLMPGQTATPQQGAATPQTGDATSAGTMPSSSGLTPGLVATPLGTTSITEVASADPQFSTLVKLLKAAGFDSTLMNRGPITVFAPTNEAFAKLPSGTVDMLMQPENIAMLQAILEYHFIPGQYVASDVSTLNGMPAMTTLRGSSLNISTTGGVHVNNASVVKTDIGAKNGVIHVVDTVLMPPMSMLKKNDAASAPDMPADKPKEVPPGQIEQLTTKPTTPVP